MAALFGWIVEWLINKKFQTPNSTEHISWEWLKDETLWVSYENKVSVLLEEAFESGLPNVSYKSGQEEIEVEHTVDFENMTEINKSSGYVQKVRRPKTGSNCPWEFEDEAGWTQFCPESSAQLEGAKNSGRKTTCLHLVMNGSNDVQSYMIDLVNMTQTHVQSGSQRNIRSKTLEPTEESYRTLYLNCEVDNTQSDMQAVNGDSSNIISLDCSLVETETSLNERRSSNSTHVDCRFIEIDESAHGDLDKTNTVTSESSSPERKRKRENKQGSKNCSALVSENTSNVVDLSKNALMEACVKWALHHPEATSLEAHIPFQVPVEDILKDLELHGLIDFLQKKSVIVLEDFAGLTCQDWDGLGQLLVGNQMQQLKQSLVQLGVLVSNEISVVPIDDDNIEMFVKYIPNMSKLKKKRKKKNFDNQCALKGSMRPEFSPLKIEDDDKTKNNAANFIDSDQMVVQITSKDASTFQSLGCSFEKFLEGIKMSAFQDYLRDEFGVEQPTDFLGLGACSWSKLKTHIKEGRFFRLKNSLEKIGIHINKDCFALLGNTSGEMALRKIRRNSKYLAFLSHYKEEAGPEARALKFLLVNYLRDIFQVDVSPTDVFLDSDHLRDLRMLRDIVQDAEYVVIILTLKMLTRPWCLIEIASAFLFLENKKCIPVYLVASEEKQFDFSVFQIFQTNLREGIMQTLLRSPQQSQDTAGQIADNCIATILQSGFTVQDVQSAITSLSMTIAKELNLAKGSEKVISAQVHDIVKVMEFEFESVPKTII